MNFGVIRQVMAGERYKRYMVTSRISVTSRMLVKYVNKTVGKSVQTVNADVTYVGEVRHQSGGDFDTNVI